MTENDLKAAYTVPELAKMMGLSRFQVGRMLTKAGIVTESSGAKRWVWISELKRRAPEAWASMLDRISAAQHADEAPAYESDEW